MTRMKKKGMQAEIDRFTLKVSVLENRVAELESRRWVFPSPPYQPFYYPPIIYGDNTGVTKRFDPGVILEGEM